MTREMRSPSSPESGHDRDAQRFRPTAQILVERGQHERCGPAGSLERPLGGGQTDAVVATKIESLGMAAGSLPERFIHGDGVQRPFAGSVQESAASNFGSIAPRTASAFGWILYCREMSVGRVTTALKSRCITER